MKVAVLGLGRSGVSAAKAALSFGDQPEVYDQGSGDSPARVAAKKELTDLGIAVHDGWSGSFIEDTVITSPGVPRTNAKLIKAVAAGKKVISEVEYAYRISKAPIVAITGTNGKSTTTVMTYLCLRACGERATLCGNIYGSGFEEVPLTEAAAKAGANEVLVAEVSSFQLEWVDQFRPVSAGITNVWPDHLDRYDGSMADYATTKQRIFAAQGPSDFAVIRANDPVVKPPHGHGSPHILTFGANGEHAQVTLDGLRILGNQIAAKDLPRHEPHNLLNSAMASLLALGYLQYRATSESESNAARILEEASESSSNSRSEANASTAQLVLPEAIISGLKQFTGLSHRMELVGEKRGVTVINNSMCTNIDAIIKSASGVQGRKHLLIGGINKGLDFKPLKSYLANHDDSVTLYGRDGQQVNEMLGGGWPIFETLQEAFRGAARQAHPGETILLAPGCASMDQFEDFRDRGNVFKQIAMEWLQS